MPRYGYIPIDKDNDNEYNEIKVGEYTNLELQLY